MKKTSREYLLHNCSNSIVIGNIVPSYGVGRKCKTYGCKTILTRYNSADKCEVCKRKKRLGDMYEQV